ncbi:MAG: hypothetical protein IPK53_10285 [bacterium]|nr:hypothetical protein [bacterium]
MQIGYGFDLPLAVVIVPLDGPTSGQTTIQRSTYSLAGQAIATRVNGDPGAMMGCITCTATTWARQRHCDQRRPKR